MAMKRGYRNLGPRCGGGGFDLGKDEEGQIQRQASNAKCGAGRIIEAPFRQCVGYFGEQHHDRGGTKGRRSLWYDRPGPREGSRQWIERSTASDGPLCSSWQSKF